MVFMPYIHSIAKLERELKMKYFEYHSYSMSETIFGAMLIMLTRSKSFPQVNDNFYNNGYDLNNFSHMVIKLSKDKENNTERKLKGIPYEYKL